MAGRGYVSADFSESVDPSLTLTRTQHAAMVGNLENNRPFTYAEFANLCNTQQPLTAHSY